MSELLENAVVSIQLGVEDYQANDPRRAISAVRNFYAGVLLLAKETLVRAAPEADLDDLVAARYKPIPDGQGGIEVVPDGRTTIDFVTIGKRFKDFGLAIDQKALEELNKIRNDVEHLYTQKPREAVREAIANAFPVVVQLFEHMGDRPGDHLGEAWPVMLEAKALYDKELVRCRDSFSKLDWISETVANAGLICPECDSKLIRQRDVENAEQRHIELICSLCGAEPDLDAAIKDTLVGELSGEAYLRIKDGGEDGPLFLCTECGNETYVDFEGACAVCGYEYGSPDCDRCGVEIPLNEIIYTEHPGLCSYCSHMLDKVMRE
ncbi:hypothetical protein [Hoeflea alexandrii]|uniref:Uncharacterized protein n=1 Tax=Hoeflea alexandrii TaxID=288436 RepID=A0ABT1CLE3_9HYPH|nr:hypothetical protein [Hoeflea alexandrii]MCO6406778.1 hypothetical protein [Hoeflea alexandrii]MCY0154747.1 hypothetical protein [Hoeflea alexandrii]